MTSVTVLTGGKTQVVKRTSGSQGPASVPQLALRASVVIGGKIGELVIGAEDRPNVLS